MRATIVSLLLAAFFVAFARPAFADARAEAAAKAASKKALTDYRAMNYGTAATRLQKALATCGTKRCSAATRASLLADLGVMQFKKGNKDDATNSWTAAAKAQPGVALNAAYASGDVQSAFDAATGAGGGGGGGGGAAGGGAAGGGAGAGGGGGQPSGDFAHTPPAEQAVDTPLPIYVEGGGDNVVRVVVKYKGAGQSSWKRIDLKKLDSGWGGLVPCADVTQGTLRYYVQGFDESKEPVASSGDSRHPYTVAIKPSISGEAPHLPGKNAPESCEKSSDCPPDFPGCSKSGESAGENGDENGEGGGEEEEAEGGKKKGGPFKRIWIGLGAEFEFMPLPSGSDLCYEDPSSSLPTNSHNMYCTNKDGTDFPYRQTNAQDNAICNQASTQATPKTLPNGQPNPTGGAPICPGDLGGNSNGGFNPANMRIMASFDYAITPNLLAGARLGVSLFVYPGNSATSDGRAFSLIRLYGDLRATWVFGENALATTGLHPMAFGGLGVAEFDTHTSSPVGICQPAGQAGSSSNPVPPPTGQCSTPTGTNYTKPVTGNVNVWQTNGPFFVMLGGGVRWAFTDSVAFTAALRVNGSFGANGLIPTLGPEIGAQYGF